ncbi:uncharacterized protein LOC144568776 [Carex rostrata]
MSIVKIDVESAVLKSETMRCQGVVLVRDAVLAKRQTKRYPTYHADYAYQQALYSQMSPQYYQYGQTSPSPGSAQPYNYPQIGFTTNPRAGRQAPQLGALSPYIQQPTALIDSSFITPVPSSLHAFSSNHPLIQGHQWSPSLPLSSFDCPLAVCTHSADSS